MSNKQEVSKVTIQVECSTLEVAIFPKTFSTGRKGYFAQIPKFATAKGNVLSGQVMLWGEKK